MKNLEFYGVEKLCLALSVFGARIGLAEDVNPYADLWNFKVCVATHFHFLPTALRLQAEDLSVTDLKAGTPLR